MNQISKSNMSQEEKDALAASLSELFGAKVVTKSKYDEINNEKKLLLEKTKDIEEIRMALLSTACKLELFLDYHKQWKPTTRRFEKRLTKLKKEKLFIELSGFPNEIAENIKEAYNCYVNGLNMACYIMILRTIEITITIHYDKNNEPILESNGRTRFVPMINKLNWAKSNRIIGGADFTVAKAFIEARNDNVHEIFVPTENQIISAFETVITLIKKL